MKFFTRKMVVAVGCFLGILFYPTFAQAATVQYATQVQTYGWQAPKNDGAVAGTMGQAKRLEAIQLTLKNTGFSGNVEYRTQIQKIGWESAFKSNGQISGTVGRALRLEGIQIRLSGEVAKHYDIYYRTHAQRFGWMGWSKNGQPAGTSGFAYRLEAIQVKLVAKNGAAPGTAYNAFRDANKRYVNARGVGLIKGSSNRIYHIPGSQYYNQTTRPIRLFQTENQAIQAGFRAPN